MFDTGNFDPSVGSFVVGGFHKNYLHRITFVCCNFIVFGPDIVNRTKYLIELLPKLTHYVKNYVNLLSYLSLQER